MTVSIVGRVVGCPDVLLVGFFRSFCQMSCQYVDYAMVASNFVTFLSNCIIHDSFALPYRQRQKVAHTQKGLAKNYFDGHVFSENVYATEV
jgi:hypothetical protein